MKWVKAKLLSAALIVACLISVIKPLDQQTAQIGAVTGGVILGGAVGAATYALLKNSRSAQQEEKHARKNKLRAILAAAIALGSGSLAWWGLSEFLFSYTPQGKYKKTSKCVQIVENDALVKKNFDDEKAILKYVNAHFGTNWPLVLCRNSMTTLLNDLRSADKLLQEAVAELQDQEDKKALLDQCNQVRDKIPYIIETLENRMTPIVDHEQYSAQAALYEKHKEADRQRKFEHAELQKKLDHQRWENEKNRESKRYGQLGFNYQRS